MRGAQTGAAITWIVSSSSCAPTTGTRSCASERTFDGAASPKLRAGADAGRVARQLLMERYTATKRDTGSGPIQYPPLGIYYPEHSRALSMAPGERPDPPRETTGRGLHGVLGTHGASCRIKRCGNRLPREIFCWSRNTWSFRGISVLVDNMGNGPMLDRATTESATGLPGGRTRTSADRRPCTSPPSSWFRPADRLDYSIRRWVIPRLTKGCATDAERASSRHWAMAQG
jgi:hypothetical protein